MSFRSYLVPEVQKVFYSARNGEIQLIKFVGDLQLVVDGLMESGAVMSRVWREGIEHLLAPNLIPKSALLLGFAGGSAAKMLSRKYPGIKITGVEIDPVMIDIAKEYFKVDDIPNLKIINQDAIEFINNCQLSAVSCQLILADCYKGFKIPEAFSDIKFLKKCVSLTDNFFINRLYWSDHVQPTDQFETKIKKHFTVTSFRSISNKVFLLRPLNRS